MTTSATTRIAMRLSVGAVKRAYLRSFGRWLCALMLALSAATGDAFAQSAIATPAIDESLFKEGSVEQREVAFDAWHLRCQEIVKMRRRFCNLLADVTDKDGNRYGSLLLATDDTGKPAILIGLTGAVRLDKPLTIRTDYPAAQHGKTTKVEYESSVRGTECDTSCKFLFPADSKLIFALNEGRDVTLSAHGVRMLDGLWLLPSAKTDALVLTVKGKGFADALKASTESW